MNLKRYRVTYSIKNLFFNTRFIEAPDVGSAMNDFKDSFPEADIIELIEV